MASLHKELAQLHAVVTSLREENHRLRQENQAVRDEVSRLKGHKGKPSIGPSRLTRKERKKRRGGRLPGSGMSRRIEQREIVRAQNVPKGSRFKGYTNFDVQELRIRTETIRYRLEKWQTPEGRLITAKLPLETDAKRGHFGASLRRFIVYQYYHALVTEPLLLEQLHELGVRISSGQLHRLIVEDKKLFHQEKNEILEVGLRVSGHIHVDDTGV